MSRPAKRPTGNAVICAHARFSLLADGLLRLEYAPDERFDDRPTFRALGVPLPQPFDRVEHRGDEWRLRADGLEVSYRPSGLLTRENLVVRWETGGMRGRWSPGDVDGDNLGGVTTLDHVGRPLVATGVHSEATIDARRFGEDNLMRTAWDVLAALENRPELDPDGQFSPENIFTAIDLLPDELRKHFESWRKLPSGPVSRAGYAVLDETGMAFYDADRRWLDRDVRPGYQNLFFLCYGHDYARALRLLTQLCGQIPIPPRWAFGPWYSCFERLSSTQNREIVATFEQHGIPLDVLVVDMDWHLNEWDGLDWNDEVFPDREAFFEWKERAGIKVALNLHCETIARADSHFHAICQQLGQPDDVADPPHPRVKNEPRSWVLDYTRREVWKAFRDTCLRPNEKLGVDFWWLDNWQGHQDGYNSVLWINHLFCRHMEETRGVRPLILGRYSGLGSHRYPVYFSGDTFSHWEVLRYLLEVNARAGHGGMCYFSHDLGGFKGPCDGEPVPLIDPELYVRWMQMGALGPVMRVHSNHGAREPWRYGKRVLEIVRDAYHLHTELVPYFYHLAREAYDTGLPIHRPLHLLFPDDERAYAATDQYFLGDRLLVAPVAAPGGRREAYIPPGTYFDLPAGTRRTGPMTLERFFELEEVPIFARAGSIIPRQTVSARVGTALPDPLILTVYPGGDDTLELYEDDGETPAYRNEAFTRWPITLRDDGRKLELLVEPIRGGFEGMLERRTLRIEVDFLPRPARVRVEGVSDQVDWAYDEEKRRVVVTLPKIATDGTYRLCIER